MGTTVWVRPVSTAVACGAPGHLSNVFEGGVVVRQTRRMATWHYIGYFNIRVFRAQRTRLSTDAAGYRFTAVLLWLVQTMADVCVFPVLRPGLHRTVRRIQVPAGVVIHRNVARSCRCFDVSSQTPETSWRPDDWTAKWSLDDCLTHA